MTRVVKISLLIICSVALAVAAGMALYRFISHRVHLPHLTEEREIYLPAERGDIFDRDGNTLASSVRLYDVYLDCAIIQSEDEWREKTLALAPQLSALFPARSESEWWDYLQAGRKQNKRYWNIVKGVSPETKDSLSRLPVFDMGQFKGGAIYESWQKRVYPFGRLARRTLGYVKGNDAKVGLEGSYDSDLRGQPGMQTVRSGWYKSERRQVVTNHVAPENGKDLYTTLDMRIQALADSALRITMKEEPGIERTMLLVMDQETGAIRSMVSLSRSANDGEIGEYYNYCIGQHYLMEDMEYKGHRLSEFCLPGDMDFDLEGRRIPEFPADAPGMVKVSLLDILSICNTIAGSGRRVQPYLVESVQRDGEPFYRHEVNVLERPAVPEGDYAVWSERLPAISIDGAGMVIQFLPKYTILYVLEGTQPMPIRFFGGISHVVEVCNSKRL